MKSEDIAPISCLVCGQEMDTSSALDDHPEDHIRALLCLEHPSIPPAAGLSELHASRDEYIQRVNEISNHVSGQSARRAWHTTGWFSLLLELDQGDLLLVYPVMRRAALLHVPSTLRAPGGPRGLRPLCERGISAMDGSIDSSTSKPGLRGLVAAVQRGLSFDGLDFSRNREGNPDTDTLLVYFSGDHGLLLTGSGWDDLGYARESDDLWLRWLEGREPR